MIDIWFFAIFQRSVRLLSTLDYKVKAFHLDVSLDIWEMYAIIGWIAYEYRDLEMVV